MTKRPYASQHVSKIASPAGEGVSESEWKPVRHHFGIRAFGVNAYIARAAGEQIVSEHDEQPDPKVGGQAHEELYYVGSGRATFTVSGERIDAPAGTFVFVRDPATMRSAVAEEPGTTVLVIGAQPGVPFEVSAWERRRTEAAAR
jgi:mannose-6-phosphate isomerase-like protein (cupin superfamily)